MTNERAKAAAALRHCLTYVLRDTVESGFHGAALHLRLAIEEIEAELIESQLEEEQNSRAS
ncbi:MAG: hypothetical protein MI755_20845 [Sphingomonadales bacterium]|nr:hypothetical protein [Sphingomonadales bacterium]